MRFAIFSAWATVAAVAVLWMCSTGRCQSAVKAAEVDWTEQRFTVQFHKEKWSQVFQWLTDQTGLVFISTEAIPPGSLTLVVPSDRKHSLQELFDLINEALLQQSFIMVRNDLSFTVIAANERLNRTSIPHIKIDDLKNRGQTELVSVILPLKTLTALRMQSDIKKMMGPFGDVVAFDQANQLFMRDTVKSLKRIMATVNKLENEYLQQAQTYSHKCKHVKATLAAEKLKEFLGDEKDKINVLDPNGKVQSIMRSHYVTASDETNTVHVNGPPEKIARAKLLMERLDVRIEQRSSAHLKTYALDEDNAEKVALALQGILKDRINLRIEAISDSSIMVYGQVDDHFSVARYIEGMRPPRQTTKVIPLSSHDATKISYKLNAIYFSDTSANVPYIDADTDANAIIVRGSDQQVKDVERTVRAMVGAQTTGSRVFTLPPGSSAKILALELQRLLPRITDAPIEVIVPGQVTPQPSAPRKQRLER